jgi:hypothetical protein
LLKVSFCSSFSPSFSLILDSSLLFIFLSLEFLIITSFDFSSSIANLFDNTSLLANFLFSDMLSLSVVSFNCDID